MLSSKNPSFSKNVESSIQVNIYKMLQIKFCKKITQLLRIHKSSFTKPLQKLFEHLLVSILGPLQFLPFPDGGGLLQIRALLCNPPPQDFVQTVQSLQFPYSRQLNRQVKFFLQCFYCGI